MTVRADKYVEYCISVAAEFQSRINRLRVFVSHNLSSGTANESILREFLSRHAPAEIDVGQGFIFDPFEKEGQVSKQCDILVYDKNNYPLVYSDGPVKVVLPGAARLVIEAKTKIDQTAMDLAIDNIVTADALCERNENFQGVIFVFRAPKNLDTTIRYLKQHPNSTDAPTAILLFDKGIIIHRYGWLRSHETRSKYGHGALTEHPYAVRRSKSGRKGAIVVTFLLLLFFHAVEARGLYQTIPINAIIEAMDEHTVLIRDDVHIGPLLSPS